MSDAPDDDALVAALNANDVEATWCGPDGIMQQAAARITELRTALAAMTAERDQARADHKRANEALAEIEDENVRLTAERDALRQTVRSLATRAGCTRSEAEDLIAECGS